MRTVLVMISLFASEGFGAGLPGLPRRRPISGADLIGMVLAHAVAIIGLGGAMCALALFIVLLVRLPV